MILPKLIGHRGALALAPENTLAGFRIAAKLGVEGVEFDVKLTADGECIVFHDDVLDRTSNGHGSVAAARYEEISRLDAGSWFDRRFSGQRIERFERILSEIASLKLFPNIELKPSPGEGVKTANVALRIAQENWPDGRAFPLITSFEHDCLALAKEIVPSWPRGLICLRVPDDWRRKLSAEEASVIVCHINGLYEADVAALCQDFSIIAYPVNDTAKAAELLGWGVSSIISDAPNRLFLT